MRGLFSQPVLLYTPLASGELWQITPGQAESPEKVPVGHDVSSPVVSASGKRLAYVQSRINGNIWRVDLDGAKAHARILVTSTREQYAPFISPDGRRVVFSSNRSGTNEIWVCDSDGGNTQQMTSLGARRPGRPAGRLTANKSSSTHGLAERPTCMSWMRTAESRGNWRPEPG